MADSQPPEGLQPDPILELITSAIPVDPVDGTTIVATQTIAGQAVVGPVWGHPSTVAALIRDKLTESGRLLPSGGEVGEELGVQIAFTDNWADGYFTASLYSPANEALARENAARHAAMEGRPVRVARRMVGPWSPVLSDNSEVPNAD